MAPELPPLDVQVSVLGDWPVEVEALASACRLTLSAEGCPEAEMSLTVLDDAGMAALNREYFEIDAPTDVIAFPLYVDGEPVLGDVYLGYEEAARQASNLEIPLSEELLRLTVHGTLHVLGHTHPEGPDRAASPMYRRQEELLNTLLGGPP
jgi:probable rRNA maturation factor